MVSGLDSWKEKTWCLPKTSRPSTRPTSFLSSGHGRSSFRQSSSRSAKLNTHVHRVRVKNPWSCLDFPMCLHDVVLIKAQSQLYCYQTQGAVWRKSSFEEIAQTCLLWWNMKIHFCVLQSLPLNLMFIGPCIIVIVEEWKTSLSHLLFYFNSYVLNMFRILIYPSSETCDCVVELPHRSSEDGYINVRNMLST